MTTAIKSEHLRIVRLEAENIKKLRVVEIEPDGNVIHITGPNGSGKSSLLDCIFMGLAGGRAIESQPVRKGEKSARIMLDLGEIIVTRKFSEDGKSTLTIEAADGGKFSSPQTILDQIIGKLSFDPLAFSRLKPKEQLDQLRQVVTVDYDIDGSDRLDRAAFEERTDINRRAKALKAQVDAIVVPGDLPAEPIDVSAMMAEVESIGKKNAVIAAELSHRAARETRAKELRTQADRLNAEASQIEDELQFTVSSGEPIDTAAIRAKIEDASRINAGIETRRQFTKLTTEYENTLRASEELTEDMAKRAERKAFAISMAKMPVPGLGFGNDEVTMNGLPFSQASSAEQLRTSVAIAMATNPQLRVLRIKDGGLLDEESMAIIAEMAADQDYQVWVETPGTHRPGIVMVDGSVAYDSRVSGPDGEVK